jgi:hypothetical protein
MAGWMAGRAYVGTRAVGREVDKAVDKAVGVKIVHVVARQTR